MENPTIPTCNPLTGEHCKILDEVLRACSLQDELIQKCTAATLPNIEGYIRDNNRMKQMAQGIRHAFFPEQP